MHHAVAPGDAPRPGHGAVPGDQRRGAASARARSGRRVSARTATPSRRAAREQAPADQARRAGDEERPGRALTRERRAGREGLEDRLDRARVGRERRDHGRRDARGDEFRDLLAAALGGPRIAIRSIIASVIAAALAARSPRAKACATARASASKPHQREVGVVDRLREVAGEGEAHQAARGGDVVGHGDLEAADDLVAALASRPARAAPRA